MADTIYDRLRKAGLIHTPEAPAGYGTSSLRVSGDRASAYAERALAGEVENVRAATKGTRNDTLNRAAWKIGRLVADGHLDGDRAVSALAEAAMATGLPGGEALKHARRGIGDGQGKQYRPSSTAPLDDEPLIEEVEAESLRGKMILSPGPSQKVKVEDQFQEDPDEITEGDLDTLFPVVDWAELWARPPIIDWIIEPILRKGKAIVLYSPPKVGKSLFTLEVAAAVATGREVLGARCTPRRVLYVDFENDPEDDVRTRLQDMGYEPAQLDNLRYLSFPPMAPLDSITGGKQIAALAKRHEAEVIIIDTLSRAVAGKENDSDTYLALYRHTVLDCKRNGIAFMRLDHSGKDAEKGMRGSSAKESDVDAIWRLSVVDVENEVLELECTHSRRRLDERKITLHRVDSPRLTHMVEGGVSHDVKVQQVIGELDRLGVPRTAGERVCKEALKRADLSPTRELLREAIAARKAVEPLWDGEDDHV